MLYLAIAAACGMSAGASAQHRHAPVNLPFAIGYGIGDYTIEGRSVQVYRIPISVSLRPEQARERWDLRLTLPVSLGIHDFEATEGGDGLAGRFETMAVTPGVELRIPVSDSVLLRPYGEIGYGTQLSGTGSELLYSVGAKARLDRPGRSVHLALGARLSYHHTDAHYAVSNAFTTTELGADLLYGGGIALGERRLTVSNFIIMSHFHGLEFDTGELGIASVEQEWEFGFTVGTEPAVTVWGMELPRVGLGYLWGDGLNGIRLNFGFPF